MRYSTWAKVVIVCSPAFRKKLVADMLRAGWSQESLDVILQFEMTHHEFEDAIFFLGPSVNAGQPSTTVGFFSQFMSKISIFHTKKRMKLNFSKEKPCCTATRSPIFSPFWSVSR
jgi:hypothetical protein